MSEAERLVGRTVAGKYRIRRLIGVGGMGAVYEGEHLDLGKKVAVKVLDSLGDASQELATRFRREARAASAVESEGIVQVFDVGRDPDVGLFMVMELLHGEDLEARLRKQSGRRLDPILAAQVAYQAARALVKAHGARVVHRDLKPANLFLTEREDGSLRVKILDFGISKLLASEASMTTSKEGMLELTQAGVALGTPQYMAPEQAQGLTTVDKRVDVWGLGVVLYEALAGIPAYPELRTYQETIINLLQTSPQRLAAVAPWVPEPLATVVHAALVHDVDKRLQDCGVFADRIVAALPDVAFAVATGAFNAHIARKLTPTPVHAAVKPLPAVGFSALAPPLPPRPAARPPTIGDDTQVVVRTGESSFDDREPSTTMLAESVRSAGSNAPPKVQVLDSNKPGALLDEGPLSTGDPTMFQAPAWVEPHQEGPATVKTGLAVDGPPRKTKPGATQAMSAAITAAIIVLVGGGGIVLALRFGTAPPASSAGAPVETPATTPVAVAAPLPSEPVAVATPSASAALPTAPASAAPAAASSSRATVPATTIDASTSTPGAPSAFVPAPPPTGTSAVPMAPATGAARFETPPPAKPEASTAAAP